MNSSKPPLVSVLTPVFNGELYIEDCIDSVLSQSYSNYEYIIVNNCSTDKTLEILNSYSKIDSRIRVINNSSFLSIIDNHNSAFREIDISSKYCKVVSADDIIFPDCLAKMVSLAEACPQVGVVGSYQLCGKKSNFERQWVRNIGLDPFVTTFPGAEVCRMQLLGQLSVFGNPTSTMYRSDLVRRNHDFFPNASAEADTSACFDSLIISDYGFVHQILSYERVHSSRQTVVSQNLNTYLPSAISDCLTYGKYFLTNEEIKERMQYILMEYYRFLGSSALRVNNKAFWAYHNSAFQALGMPLDKRRVAFEAAKKFARTMKTPARLFDAVIERTRRILY